VKNVTKMCFKNAISKNVKKMHFKNVKECEKYVKNMKKCGT